MLLGTAVMYLCNITINGMGNSSTPVLPGRARTTGRRHVRVGLGRGFEAAKITEKSSSNARTKVTISEIDCLMSSATDPSRISVNVAAKNGLTDADTGGAAGKERASDR